MEKLLEVSAGKGKVTAKAGKRSGNKREVIKKPK
jgi:hypothetical protein